MANKKIIAYCMSEDDADLVRDVMAEAEWTESYAMGELDESGIERLRADGILVEVVEAPAARAETPGMVALSAARVRSVGSSGGSGEGPGGLESMRVPEIDRSKPNVFLIRLSGPLIESRREELESLGANILDYVPAESYTARLMFDQVESIRQLGYVEDMRLFGPEDSEPTVFSESAQTPFDGLEAAQVLTFDVRLHVADDLEAVRAWLEDEGVEIDGAKGRKLRIQLADDSPVLDDLKFRPEVQAIEEYVPPRFFNDAARRLLGVDTAGAPQGPLTQTGKGQIVAVADTGLDETHPDFQGRIVAAKGLGRPGDASDPHGHGTHVAGSVLGDGKASSGAIRGTAPGAELYFQSIMDSSGRLGGLPLDLADLFGPAHKAGARIHSNSWGAGTEATYTFNSTEVDEFVAAERDMLLVFAAGNDGKAATRRHSDVGHVDWLSMGSPATAKNALTVGASQSDRTSGGFSTKTYSSVWPGSFPDPPIGAEKISGDPQSMGAFSSRGPCDDRRIKPDVVAPGTDILSVKSSTAPSGNFWGTHSNSSYAYMGGTSMATPLVSGCAALVREYLVDERQVEPSAALIKAILVNSTRWLTGSSSVSDHAKLPNLHQGFGCVHMPLAIPNPSQPGMVLAFVDTWKDPAVRFSRTGERFRFGFKVTGGSFLRLCFTWMDSPGRSLQNQLGILMQSPSRKRWSGNEDRRDKLTEVDRDNNVQVIRVDDPEPGDYTVMLFAHNLLKTGQDFALVVTGELEKSELTRF